MRKKTFIEIGTKYGKWLVLEKGIPTKDYHVQYLCRCECGTEALVRDFYLIQGKSIQCKSCRSKKANLKHGYTRKHPLYRVWASIVDRCERSNNSHYRRYGGRGITICDEWRYNSGHFIDWCLDNGWKKGLQIDRINNDGNYEPSNCRFVTSVVNNRNKNTIILTVEDIVYIQNIPKETYSSKELAEKYNCHQCTIQRARKYNLQKLITSN